MSMIVAFCWSMVWWLDLLQEVPHNMGKQITENINPSTHLPNTVSRSAVNSCMCSWISRGGMALEVNVNIASTNSNRHPSFQDRTLSIKRMAEHRLAAHDSYL